MKLLFVHDFYVEFNENTNAYYSSGFPNKIWERYLLVFNEIKIISRIKKSIKNDENSISSGENISFSPINEYKNLLSLIKNYKKIEKKLIKEIKNTDAVLIRLPSILGFLAAKICRQLNKPYAVEIVGSIFKSYWYYGGVLAKLLAFPGDLLQKKYIKHSSVAIYITEFYLQRIYPTKGLSFGEISNVEIDNYDLSKNVNSILDTQKTIKIGMVGSTFVKYKGHKLALKMIRRLINKGYNVSFEVVGQGPSESFQKQVEKLKLGEFVNFIGKIDSRYKMNEWYQSLDFYIQPSKTEGHGRAVVEAISNRVPVITSRAGGLKESVENSYSFDYGDLSSFTNLVEKLINNNEFRLNNIAENYNKVSNNVKEVVTKKRVDALKAYKNIVNGEIRK